VPDVRSIGRWLAGAAGLGAASYAAYVGFRWVRYGHVTPPANSDEDDLLLDRFMPIYEVVERHYLRVAAPAEMTLAAASAIDLRQSAVVRGIFKCRELILGSQPEAAAPPRGLVAQAKAWGWGVLAENPGREIVFGAVTQPWLADVVFRALPPDEFAAFDEPGYAKIAWTLRADPVGAAASMARTETRVATTDAAARARFRRYWSLVSPGVALIRRLALRLVRATAVSRAREESRR
jgi:hypothetical protein